MKKFIAILLGCSSLTLTYAQKNYAVSYAETITSADLKDRLSIIASDALEGRMTGSRGQKMAAAFISDHFKRIGLQPPVSGSYLQPFELYAVTRGEVFIKAAGSTFQNYSEVIYLGNTSSNGEKKVDVVFAGYGRESDYEKLNVSGKAVVILQEELKNFNMQNLPVLTKRAHQKGATLVLYTSDFKTEKFLELGKGLSSYLDAEDWSLDKPQPSEVDSGSFLILNSVVEKVFQTSFSKLVAAAKNSGSLSKFKNGQLTYQITMKTSTLQTENVLGYLEGSDKKDELVIVTAHYDHVGKEEGEGEGDVIYNGADDDGSGTVAVMEIAEAFAEAKRNGHGPRRSMLFMTVTGEELGLFGSEYYVTHPVYPLAQTVANLNIDMIGRKDGNYELKSDYVYVIGSDKLSKELHNINEKANQQHTQLIFDYVYNDEAHPDRLYYRSDHWNFARNQIPIIFYFDGIHSDYHQVTDEADRINYELLKKRTKLVFHTAWEVANRENRLKLD